MKDDDKSICCPLDLDSLLMSKGDEDDPSSMEVELNVDDDILWDAVRLSTCSYWLYKISVLKKFSKNTRTRLFKCVEALPTIMRAYLEFQLMEFKNDGAEQLNQEYDQALAELGIPRMSLELMNPATRLGNNGMIEMDKQVVRGEITLRGMMLQSIRTYLLGDEKKHNDSMDFSHSLFLPEILNPKFFRTLGNAEQLVVLLNMDKYSSFLGSFFKHANVGMRRRSAIAKCSLCPCQLLYKHVFTSNYPIKTKNVAWMKFFQEMCSPEASNDLSKTGFTKLFDKKALDEEADRMVALLNDKDIKLAQLFEWADNAQGVFESFELDCTLHGLDSSEFFMFLVPSNLHRSMIKGMLDFQDDEGKDKLFKKLGDMITPFR